MNHQQAATQQQIQKAQAIGQLKAEKVQLERRMKVTQEGISALLGISWKTSNDEDIACCIDACHAMAAVQLSQLKLALVEGQERMAQIDAYLQRLQSSVLTATLSPGTPSSLI